MKGKSTNYVANTHKVAQMIALDFLEDLDAHDFIGPTLYDLTALKDIRMMYKPLNDANAEGFCAIGKGQKFLYVNTNFNVRLQNFTVAHELWHIHLHDLPNVFNFNEIDIERAADHFAANILLPTKNVLNKYYHLKQSGKSASPYEAVLKRFVELDINTKQIDEQLNTITMRNEDPYITLIEHKLQQLRCHLALAKSSLDTATKISMFPELDSLKLYFSDKNSEAAKHD